MTRKNFPTGPRAISGSRARAAALVSGAALALLLAPGEARAGAVCSNTPGVGDRIECEVASGATEDIDIDAASVTISTGGFSEHAIHARNRGTGDVDIDVTDSSLSAGSFSGNGVLGRHDGRGDVSIDVTDTIINTADTGVYGYRFAGFGSVIQTGDLAIRVSGGSITTTGSLGHGVRGQQTATGDISVHLANGVAIKTAGGAGARLSLQRSGRALLRMEGGSSIETSDYLAYGVHMDGSGNGDFEMDAREGSITTAGDDGRGVYVNHTGSGGIIIRMKDFRIGTSGERAFGVWADHNSTSSRTGVTIDLEDVSVTTKGEDARGFRIESSASYGSVTFFRFRGGSVSTEGDEAEGVFIESNSLHIDAGDPDGGDGAGGISGVDIRTKGRASHGVHLSAQAYYTPREDEDAGALAAFLDFRDGSVLTEGDGAHGLYVRYSSNFSVSGVEVKTLLALRGGSVTAEGLDAAGAFARHLDAGSVSLTIDAESAIKAPFGVGAEGRLESEARGARTATAADGVRATHEGEIEARDAGVIARAALASGSTFEAEGTEEEDEAPAPAARTQPIIHVTSGGDITVGQAVADAFIRERIAGSDGTLSAGERAVLSAITGEDSDALETALGALSDSYDEDWKAEARELLRKRADAPTGDAERRTRAADEALDLPAAGIRALALDHRALAMHVREGDVDASLTRGWPPLSEEETETLAAQRNLSAVERAVLAAALDGGDLEAALAALPAAYSDAWKDGVRRLALSYSAGDIRVDVTGGAIVSEGDGVQARFAVPHDRNGAISMSVARGASVSGGRNGLYLSGAGAGEDGFRAQSVRVDGAVTGGTGAGVYMRGGGRLTVGETGRISAESGAGVLADGPGNFHAAIAGRVEGDVRGTGSGEHTVEVAAGGEVTGTIHLAASAVTLEGAAGRVLLERGGTVTLGAAGRLVGSDEGAVEFLGGDSSRLRFGLRLPAARRVQDAIGGDAWLTNDGGGTDIFINGVKLHDAERGSTGLAARVGARDVSVTPSAVILGRNFYQADFSDSFAPRAGIYETLPGLLLRLENGRARGEEALSFPDSPVWTRVFSERGSGAGGSTVDAKRDFDRFEAEAGARVPLLRTKGLAVWGVVRLSEVSADVSTPGGRGGMEIEGLGLGGGVSWRNEGGWYMNGGILATDYGVDVSSKSAGALKKDADALVRTLGVEAGRRAAFRSAKLSFTPRAWLTRSRTTIDSFTDAVGARFSLVRANRLAGGAGVLAQAHRPLAVGGGTLALRGSADVEGILNGARTTVEVSGERLHSDAEQTRFLLGLGARWRAGRFSLDAALSADGLGSGEKTWGGRLSLGMRF